MNIVDVYNYSNYKTFLKTYFEEKKKTNSNFSLRVWARMLNLGGPSTLSMILNGVRHPGINLLDKLNQYFNFSEPRRHYFELLVRLAKANNGNAIHIMERLKEIHPDKSFHMLDTETFNVISKWYFYAIREMIHLADFREDYEWITKKLGGKIKPKDAEYAINTMLKVGVLERDLQTKKLVISKKRITTTQDIASEAIKRFHLQMIDRAKESIREVPVEERDNSASTLTINKSKIKDAKQLITHFSRELCKLLEAEKGNATYQLNIQFFPLTKT
jgi:uncharacterized protein (TIGR02147 family)